MSMTETLLTQLKMFKNKFKNINHVIFLHKSNNIIICDICILFESMFSFSVKISEQVDRYKQIKKHGQVVLIDINGKCKYL